MMRRFAVALGLISLARNVLSACYPNSLKSGEFEMYVNTKYFDNNTQTSYLYIHNNGYIMCHSFIFQFRFCFFFVCVFVLLPLYTLQGTHFFVNHIPNMRICANMRKKKRTPRY